MCIRDRNVDVVEIAEFVAESERTAGRNDRIVQPPAAQRNRQVARNRFRYHITSSFVNTGPSLQMRLLPYLVLQLHPMQAPNPQPMRSSKLS